MVLSLAIWLTMLYQQAAHEFTLGYHFGPMEAIPIIGCTTSQGTVSTQECVTYSCDPLRKTRADAIFKLRSLGCHFGEWMKEEIK
jgi:hypothetical protein